MRDPERIDVMLAALKALWVQQPDTRLGQLISSVAYLNNGKSVDPVFYIEDDAMLRALEDY